MMNDLGVVKVKILLILSLLFSMSCEAAGVPVLLYHQVSSEIQPSDTSISLGRFEEEMKYLHDNGYQTLSVMELVDIMDRQVLPPEKAVVITFDDGWYSVMHNALSVLSEYNMKATFFIITGSLQDPYMTLDQLKTLSKNPNFDVQSHTVTNPSKPDNNLVMWSEETSKNNIVDALVELDDSKLMLEQNLNKKVNYLAWPAEYNQVLLDLARVAGYKATFTLDDGVYQCSYCDKESNSSTAFHYHVAGCLPLEPESRAHLDAIIRPQLDQ